MFRNYLTTPPNYTQSSYSNPNTSPTPFSSNAQGVALQHYLEVNRHFIFEDNYKITIANIVTESELQFIFKMNPGLRLTTKIKKHDNFYVIESLGVGNFSNAQLAFQKSATEEKFVAIRMLNTPQEYMRKHGNSEHRHNAFNSTQTELAIHKELSAHIGNIDGLVLTRKVIEAQDETYNSSSDNANQLYQIMSLYDCGTLNNISKIFASFPVGQDEEHRVIHYLAASFLIALNKLHNVRTYHRDLKPDNVLLSSDGKIGITDFGCAAYVYNDELKFINESCNMWYSPPTFITNFHHDYRANKSEKMQLHRDCWSAALTICSIISDDIEKFINEAFINETRKNNNKQHCFLLHEILQRNISTLMDMLDQENISLPLKELIFTLFNLDFDKTESLNSILSTHEWIGAINLQQEQIFFSNIIKRSLQFMNIQHHENAAELHDDDIFVMLTCALRLLAFEHQHPPFDRIINNVESTGNIQTFLNELIELDPSCPKLHTIIDTFSNYEKESAFQALKDILCTYPSLPTHFVTSLSPIKLTTVTSTGSTRLFEVTSPVKSQQLLVKTASMEGDGKEKKSQPLSHVKRRLF